MSRRSTTASRLTSLVSMVLLLATTSSATLHDHLGDRDSSTNLACVVDHSDHGTRLDVDRPHFDSAGERHHHDCIGCHFGGKRSFAAATSSESVAPLLERVDRSEHGHALVATGASGHSPRGPPRT